MCVCAGLGSMSRKDNAHTHCMCNVEDKIAGLFCYAGRSLLLYIRSLLIYLTQSQSTTLFTVFILYQKITGISLRLTSWYNG